MTWPSGHTQPDAHKAYLRAEERQSRTWGVDLSDASAGQLADRLSYYRGDGSELALWSPEDIYMRSSPRRSPSIRALRGLASVPTRCR